MLCAARALMFVAFFPLSGFAAQDAQPKSAEQARIDEVVNRLAEKASSLNGLYLRYETNHTIPPGADACPEREIGLQYWDQSVEILVSLAGCPDESPVHERLIWNGKDLSWQRTAGQWTDALLPPRDLLNGADAASEGNKRSIASFCRISLPSQLGLFWGGTPWATVLKGLKHRSIIGQRVVCGVPAMVIVGDMGEDGGAAYTIPCRLTIDESATILVLGVELFSRPSRFKEELRREQDRDGRSLTLAGETWYRGLYIEVTEVGELGSTGLYIGTEGKAGIDEARGVFTTTRIAGAESGIDSTLAGVLGGQGIRDGTPTEAVGSGELYYYGHRGDKVYSSNRIFGEHLAKWDRDVTKRWVSSESLAQSMLTWPTRCKAILGYLLLSNHDVAPIDLASGPLASRWFQRAEMTAADLVDELGEVYAQLATARPGTDPLPTGVPLLFTRDDEHIGMDGLEVVMCAVDGSVTYGRPGVAVQSTTMERWIASVSKAKSPLVFYDAQFASGSSASEKRGSGATAGGVLLGCSLLAVCAFVFFISKRLLVEGRRRSVSAEAS